MESSRYDRNSINAYEFVFYRLGLCNFKPLMDRHEYHVLYLSRILHITYCTYHVLYLPAGRINSNNTYRCYSCVCLQSADKDTCLRVIRSMKITVFRDVTTCSLIIFTRFFRESTVSFSTLFSPEDGGNIFLRNRKFVTT